MRRSLEERMVDAQLLLVQRGFELTLSQDAIEVASDTGFCWAFATPCCLFHVVHSLEAFLLVHGPLQDAAKRAVEDNVRTRIGQMAES